MTQTDNTSSSASRRLLQVAFSMTLAILCQINACDSFHMSFDSDLYAALYADLYTDLYAALYAVLYADLYAALYTALYAALYADLYTALYADLYAALYTALYADLYAEKCSAGPLLIYTLTAFATVQIGIWRMINTAREACSDAEQRRRLQFLRNVTPHVWNTFWFMWFCQYFGILTVFQAELGNMIGNFVAKVIQLPCAAKLVLARSLVMLAVSDDCQCACCSNDCQSACCQQ